jgi:hypothetical protein
MAEKFGITNYDKLNQRRCAETNISRNERRVDVAVQTVGVPATFDICPKNCFVRW